MRSGLALDGWGLAARQPAAHDRDRLLRRLEAARPPPRRPSPSASGAPLVASTLRPAVGEASGLRTLGQRGRTTDAPPERIGRGIRCCGVTRPRRRRPRRAPRRACRVVSRPSVSASSASTGASESLPRSSIFVISTRIFWPTPSTSSTFSTRLPPASLRTSEMCSRPSLPGSSEMNAPKAAIFTTVPRNCSPTSGLVGLAIALTWARAASAEGPSVAPM